MKKLILSLASLCLVLSIYSCRETTEEKAADALENAVEDTQSNLEKAGDAIEEAVEDTGDAIEEGVQEVKDEVEGNDDN
ncbi:hypothetical protein [Ulvibacter antarcticus]|uniref:YtxH-like protein n=1 Tax=Ulvibacter antarcticus TaxID=442714 RepID=A0A3L9YDT6_9FLAO|nr:hypothetical protein [Ulvibacter antarcticus]RMA57597.1 hypothetical protein BXY75_2400 [Ulvibacter antarcticus]